MDLDFPFPSIALKFEGKVFKELLKNEGIKEPILMINNNQLDDRNMKLGKDAK